MYKHRIKKTLLVIVGTFILSLAVGVFILPYNILSGGVAGIAVAIEPFVHVDKQLVTNFLVLALFVIGCLFLGKEFAVNTVISSITYPIFLTFISSHIPVMEIDPLLASLYGGLLGGIGIGLVMRTGASTGGMDVPPLIVNKLTGVKVSTLVLITDGLTVLIGLMAYDIPSVLIGFISVFATSYAIEKVLMLGGQTSKSVQIISEKYLEIADTLQQRLDRGTTIFDAQGGYTKSVKKVILCVVSNKQYNELIEIVNELDKEAFIITTDATDVHGEGFSFGFKV